MSEKDRKRGGRFVTVEVDVIGVLEGTVGSWPSKHVFRARYILLLLADARTRALYVESHTHCSTRSAVDSFSADCATCHRYVTMSVRTSRSRGICEGVAVFLHLAARVGVPCKRWHQ